MPSRTSLPADASRDERLADLLAGLTSAVQQGRPADVEQVAAAHPDLADELRKLWARRAIAHAFSRPSKLPPTLPFHGPISVDAPTPSLPRPPSATSICWANWDAAAWALSTKPGRPACNASLR